MTTFSVPTMASRSSLRAISARVCDVAGVRTVEADLRSRTVVVSGTADPGAVRAALVAAGHPDALLVPAASRVRPSPARSTSMTTSTAEHGASAPVPGDSFATDAGGLPATVPTAVREYDDGATVDLHIAPVAHRVGGATLRMLAYGGSVPGPTFVVRQGSRLWVRAVNGTDLETTVHWHGLRLANRFDGVPHETQQPIPPGGEFTYRLDFPDPGLYWYHPHVREDYTQEMGLYGTILVRPADPDHWAPVHRDVVLTIDDVLVEDGVIGPFSRWHPTHAAMGRFGNVLLVDGRTEPQLTARAGEVVRLWLVNTANARVFDVRLPGARLKLVGGDSGRVEHEEFVDRVLLAPSERAVVDVLFERPGAHVLEHRTPERTYRLARITVSDDPVDPAPRASFEVLRSDPDLAAERRLVQRWQDAPPDEVLAAVAEMDGMTHGAGHGAGHGKGHGTGHGTGHGVPGDQGGADGIEWEDGMAATNRQSTPATTRWSFRDRTDGGDGLPTGWHFAVGDRVKIRLVNEVDSDHPMHHPFHVHGGGRFLVLARDGVPEANLMWKDTVLLRTGETVDILFSATNPGRWMAHCHIPEHMHSGMMFGFTVGEPA